MRGEVGRGERAEEEDEEKGGQEEDEEAKQVPRDVGGTREGAGEGYPGDLLLNKWVDGMQAWHGDWQKLPKVGCGSVFVPWRKGLSMVVEVKCDDGT